LRRHRTSCAHWVWPKVFRTELILGQGIQSLFQVEAELFAVGVGEVAGDGEGFAEFHDDTGEGKGDLKSVPTFQAKLPAQALRGGDDGQAGDLGEGNDALLDNVTGTARAVGGDGEVVAAF